MSEFSNISYSKLLWDKKKKRSGHIARKMLTEFVFGIKFAFGESDV